MTIEASAVVRALRLPGETGADVEPLGEAEGSACRVVLRPPERAPFAVIVRTGPGGEAAANNLAVLEALGRAGYRRVPRLLGVLGEAAIEEAVEGVTALQVVPPQGSPEAVMAALAELHALPLREGLRWELSPGEWFEDARLPLFRLGFASNEREAADEPLAEAIRELRAGPWGFVHGNTTAEAVVLAPAKAWLTGFGRAGFGPQLWDVASWLLTSGLDGEQRAVLAGKYGRARGWQPSGTAAAVDLAGVLWGLDWLLGLPRRLIEALGDDALSYRLHEAAARIETGLRDAAGSSPVALRIREALWG